MLMNRIVEYVFFFGLMAVVAYLVWEMFAPFVSALALAAIIVTVSHPLYERITARMPRHNETIGAFVTTIVVFLIVVFPLFLLGSALVNEALAVYRIINTGEFGVAENLQQLEELIRQIAPGFSLNVEEYLRQVANFLASNLGAIFAGTATTVFHFFIAMIGSFYLFRDGQEFTRRLINISPLPDDQDDRILGRMAQSLRAVLTGIVLVAIIQGTLTAIGLWLFGFERAILWGAIAAFGALIPSIGTSIVFVPAVLYLLFIGDYLSAFGVTVWGTLAVGLIDNLLGPYLISRGNYLHPFIVLLSVLGGIAAFGPIGFVVGPVLVTLLMVLLELYAEHIAQPTTEHST